MMKECKFALKALEEAEKETVEAVKKTKAFHRPRGARTRLDQDRSS